MIFCAPLCLNMHTDGLLHKKIDLTHGDRPVNTLFAKSLNIVPLKCPSCMLSGVENIFLKPQRKEQQTRLKIHQESPFSFKEQIDFYVISSFQ